ncbi:MAG TPA: hypothetical protein VFG42_13025 [Baekduia sp.]|uniref:hypothetical protein n=1 Tax=Baekduia sp. TaxID=2600305 RepID=UPI002D77214C|nr:hypothetical protein [Baekduia sp.]HET6507706.1 hypothetical protein [Baekduia sp.]
MRRARRAGAIAAEIDDLVAEFGVPLPTAAVRVLLADRDRPTTAEHLARVAASERAEHLRTRVAPRLCCAIAPDGALVAPRWWASGEWRLPRRILTEDALPLWRAKLAEQVCSDLIARRRPASGELTTLVRGTVALLGLADELERLPDPSDWSEVRALVLDYYPGVTFAHDVSTDQQDEAERALLEAGLPVADRYFGISRHRGRG